MLATVLLAVALPPAPAVRMEVVMVPKTIRQGEKIEANLIIRNLSKKPVAVAEARGDGGMSAGAWVQVLFDGKPLTLSTGESSMPILQTGINNEVTSDRFQHIPAGGYVNVYWIKFDKAFEGPIPRNKGDFARQRPVPLQAGTYEVRGTYRFDKQLRIGIGGPQDVYEFTPSAKRLFDMAYAGTLKASGRFTVTPK